MDVYQCKYCQKLLKNANAKRGHERFCALNPNREALHFSNQNWAKGLSKETDSRIANNSKSKKAYFIEHPGTFSGRTHSDETKKKISESQLAIDHDQHNRNSHGKRGYFDGIFFMSTWELAFYLYMKHHNHRIEKCKLRFPYTYHGKNHTYTPDFIVDGRIVEIKGRETDLDRFKYTLVENILIIKLKDIVPMISYVKELYNISDIEVLYQSN